MADATALCAVENEFTDWRTAPVPVIAGLSDTRRTGSQPYAVRPLGEILFCPRPYTLAKERAPAFLPSLYANNDARSHNAQRDRGQFIALVGDVDHGNHSLEFVSAKVRQLAGDAAWRIYSTASARPDDQRWRIVIPLASPIPFPVWYDAQLAFVEFMRGEGVDMDSCATRPGQVSFLPNVPHEARGSDGEPLFFQSASSDTNAPGLTLASGAIGIAVEAIRKRHEADDAERDRIRREAFRRRSGPIASGDGESAIDRFNAAHDLPDLLERYGYERHPRNPEDWRSPMQTSSSYATRVIDGGKWISLSGSDCAAGLGETCRAGCFGDAFDLFAHYEHGGDRKAALRELHQERKADQSGFDPETGEVFGDDEDPAQGDESDEDALPLPTLDLEALAGIDPQNKVFAIERLAPLGEVTLFTGAGSAGKSLLGQQLATCAAAGVPILGLNVMQTPALYLTCEDDDGQLHWRQASICRALNLSMGSLAGVLHLSSLRGALDSELAVFTPDGTVKPTRAFWRLSQMVRETGTKLAILDNVAHLFTGNENDRGDVTRFVNLLNKLAGDTGAAILLIGHPNKSGADYSGSTAWLNAVRSQIVLTHDLETDVRTLTVGKANYAPKGEALRFIWLDGAFVREDDLPPDQAKELASAIRASGDNETFLRCLRERNRQQRAVSEAKGTNYAPNQFARMPESGGIGKDRLELAMDRLFRIGAIERGELPWKCRDRHAAIGLREAAANGAAN